MPPRKRRFTPNGGQAAYRKPRGTPGEGHVPDAQTRSPVCDSRVRRKVLRSATGGSRERMGFG